MDSSQTDMDPKLTRRNLRIVYAIGVGSVVLLLLAAAHINAQFDSINHRLEKELSTQHALLGQFDQRVQELERTIRLPTEGGDLARNNDNDKALRIQIDSILSRLDRIEAETDQASHLQRGSAPISENDDSEPFASEIAAIEEQLSARRSPPPPVDSYTKERGQSEWGKDVAGRINWTYADASFFAQYGGNLSVDCRQTSCKAVWEPPEISGRDQPEVDREQALSEYELMAVVAKGGGNIGPIYTASRLNESNPRIEVYFTRNSTE